MSQNSERAERSQTYAVSCNHCDRFGSPCRGSQCRRIITICLFRLMNIGKVGAFFAAASDSGHQLSAVSADRHDGLSARAAAQENGQNDISRKRSSNVA
jgi:hypothetical protein